MLKNLHLKFFSLLLATIFWIFVVSLENTFYQVPQEIPVQVFNQAAELALASKLGAVKVTVRTQNGVALRTLSASDFEAYVDLRNLGTGLHEVPVSVTSTNPQVSVVRIEPKEIKIELEPTREKIIPLTLKVTGNPARGFRVSDSLLLKQNVVVSGAQSVVKNVVSAVAEVSLTGNENQTSTKDAVITVLSRSGEEVTEILIEPKTASARIVIIEEEVLKQVSVKTQTVGAIKNGILKSIDVTPATLEITGLPQLLDDVEFLQTEAVDLSEISESEDRKVKIVLPEGISLTEGQSKEVTVKITVESAM